MGATRVTPFLLGLVLVATVFAAAEGGRPCSSTCGGGGGLEVVGLDLSVDLGECKSAVEVAVDAVVLAGKGKKQCPGRKVTPLGPLKLKLALKRVVAVRLVLLGKGGKPVLEVLVKLDLVKLRVKLVGGRYPVVLKVVVDEHSKQLRLLCLGELVHAPIDIQAYLELLGLVKVGVDIGLGGHH